MLPCMENGARDVVKRLAEIQVPSFCSFSNMSVVFQLCSFLPAARNL